MKIYGELGKLFLKNDGRIYLKLIVGGDEDRKIESSLMGLIPVVSSVP